MKNEIILELQAQDFDGTDFLRGQCAVEKALNRQEGLFGLECVESIIVNGQEYTHERYSRADFLEDKDLAKLQHLSDQTIRTLTLKKI